MTLSSVKRLQTAARVERLETLIDRQISRLRLAKAMGWPTADLERMLKILKESHEMFESRLSADTQRISQQRGRRKRSEG